MSNLLSNYNTNAMSSDTMINDLKTKRNNTLTSAYNTLNQELQAKYTALESMGGDIEKISGVIAGGLTTAKGIGESVKKVYKKYKKKTQTDDDDEDIEDEDITDGVEDGIGDDISETVSNTADNIASSASDAVSNATSSASDAVSNVTNMISSRASSLIANARSAIENGAMRGQRFISNTIRNIKNIGQPKQAKSQYNTEPDDPEEGVEMKTFGDDEGSKIEDGTNYESKTEDLGVDDESKVSDLGAEEGADITENVGEDVGESVAETAGEIGAESAAEIAGEVGLEAAGSALDATGIGAIVGIPLQILAAGGLIASVGEGINMASQAGEKLQEGLKTSAENLQKAKQQAVDVAGKFSVPSFSSVNAFNN